MNSTQELESAYEAAHIELNQLYKTFHDKPGYVRVKTGEELALQEAKKVFGRFSPNDHDLMESNTNNGQGFTVQLEDGQTIHLNNQLELYNKIVSFNKMHGGFCDEKFIEITNEQDFILLKSLQFNVETAKESLVNSYPDRKSGYAKARQIEKKAHEDFKQATQQVKGQRTAQSNSQPHKAARPQTGQRVMPATVFTAPKMRTPLLSSIPNTFRQAKSLFQRSDVKQKEVSKSASSFVSKNSAERRKALEKQFEANIIKAKSINAALSEPVSESSTKDLKKLCEELNANNTKIDDLVGDGSIVNKQDLDDYSIKLKKETDEMKARSANHPSAGVREAISSTITKLFESLKNAITKIASLISKRTENNATLAD